MIALDTNLLVRLALRDEAAQLRRVEALLADEVALILTSVLLETEWVLRSRYLLQPAEIAAFFNHLATADSLEFENPATALVAITAYEHGMGFTDALHAAAASHLQVPLYTFDAALKRKAARIENVRIETP